MLYQYIDCLICVEGVVIPHDDCARIQSLQLECRRIVECENSVSGTDFMGTQLMHIKTILHGKGAEGSNVSMAEVLAGQ